MKNSDHKSNVKLKILTTIAKYFIHGIFYSLFFWVWPIGFYAVVIILFIDDGILWRVITIFFFILILGFSNSVISFYLWHPVKLSFWRIFSILLQGLVLLVTLMILGVIFSTHLRWITDIFDLLYNPFTLKKAKFVAALILVSLLIGFVGRKSAEWPRKEET